MNFLAASWNPLDWIDWDGFKEFCWNFVRDLLLKIKDKFHDVYTRYQDWLGGMWDEFTTWLLGEFPNLADEMAYWESTWNTIDLFFPLHETMVLATVLLALYWNCIAFKFTRTLLPKWLGGI